jgi:hypothetical protein
MRDAQLPCSDNQGQDAWTIFAARTVANQKHRYDDI